MGVCTRCFDVFLMFLIFTPMIALYKKTGNEIVENLILNRSPSLGPWFLLAVGIGIKVSLLVMRNILAQTVLSGEGVFSTMAYYTVTYLIGISTVCHIRAISDLYHIYMGGAMGAALRTLTTVSMLLMAMKATKNLVSVPLVLKNDVRNDRVLKVGTFLGMPGGIVDAFVTVAVVHSVVHTFWAAWHAVLSASHLSGLTCLFVGMTICFWIIVLNGLIKAISRSLENKDFDLPRLAFEDMYHIFATMSLITGRKGVSYVIKIVRQALARYLPVAVLNTVSLHLLAFAFLCAVGVSLSLGSMGGAVDGAAKGGNDIVCRVKYFDQDNIETEEKKVK